MAGELQICWELINLSFFTLHIVYGPLLVSEKVIENE